MLQMKAEGSFGVLFIANEEPTIDYWFEEVRSCFEMLTDWLIELTRPCGWLVPFHNFQAQDYFLLAWEVVKQLVGGLVWFGVLRQELDRCYQYWRHKERSCCPKPFLPYRLRPKQPVVVNKRSKNLFMPKPFTC